MPPVANTAAGQRVNDYMANNALVFDVKRDIEIFISDNHELLFNERDFQMRLALSLINSECYDDVDLEYHLPVGQKFRFDDDYKNWDTEKPSIDIVVRKGCEYVPIELKYKLQAVSGNITRFGEEAEKKDISIITNQAAQNLGRYAFWKDVKRLELVKKHYAAVNNGIVVFLTNDATYLKESEDADYSAFSMSENRMVTGQLDWKQKKNKYPQIILDGEYIVKWQKVSFNEMMPVVFYTIVTI